MTSSSSSLSDPASSDHRIVLCVATFYAELAEKLVEGARMALTAAAIADFDRYEVPGAFELPLAAKYAAESGKYDAVVCLGAVIRGDTDHYEYVCREAAHGIQLVALGTGIPVGFGLLTVESMEQALDRVTGGSKRDTGRAAVEAALASLAVKEEFRAKRGRAGFAI